MLHLNAIIPKTLNEICLKFYYSRHIIYLYSAGIHAYDFDTKTKWKSVIYDINDSNSTKDIGRETTSTGYCTAFMAKNIKLPTSINDKICDLYNISHKNNKLFNVIFKCGGHRSGNKNDCHATIFDPNQFNQNNIKNTVKSIKSFDWKLPDLTQRIWGTNTIYSQRYGLYYIVGSKVGSNVGLSVV